MQTRDLTVSLRHSYTRYPCLRFPQLGILKIVETIRPHTKEVDSKNSACLGKKWAWKVYILMEPASKCVSGARAQTACPLCARKKWHYFTVKMGSVWPADLASNFLFGVSCKYLPPFLPFFFLVRTVMVRARSRSFRRTIIEGLRRSLRWWPPHHCSVPPLPPATLVRLILDLHQILLGQLRTT